MGEFCIQTLQKITKLCQEASDAGWLDKMPVKKAAIIESYVTVLALNLLSLSTSPSDTIPGFCPFHLIVHDSLPELYIIFFRTHHSAESQD